MATPHQPPSSDPVKLLLRLPPEVHRRLQGAAQANDRSLNAEIVHALRRYAEGLVEIRYSWDETEEQTRRAWDAIAGETLPQSDGWEHTPEEAAEVEALLRQRGIVE